MLESRVPPVERDDLVRHLISVYERPCTQATTGRHTAMTTLLTDLIRLLSAAGVDPIEEFLNALVAAGQGDSRPCDGLEPERRTYLSILVRPVDGVTTRVRRGETTDMEVAIMRHDELVTRTGHRAVVIGRRGDADVYHDHEHLPSGPIADAAVDLWERYA